MYTKGSKLVKEVALRLQQLRKRAGLSASEMAGRVGITRGGYSKNERGKNLPGLETISIIAKDFDISMDWLFFNKGPMHYKEREKREKELEQTVEKLTQTAEELKHRLDEANRKQEKADREKAEAIETIPEVRELLDHMARDQVYYHRLMLEFQEYKKREKEAEDTPTS